MGCRCATRSIEDDVFLHSLREIPGPIGSGQYSTVKEGLTNSDQVVAVKCIDLTRISKTLRFLRRELDIMKSAKHPSIVQYFGVYRDNKTIYISMEMCACSLKQKILMRGKLPEKEVIAIARDVISALEYLHKMHVAHRDIKPENILFDTEDRVKLVDFGLSRSLVMEKDITIVGTPYYLAPEVLGGTYSYECDMWSLGVVLYYALFGVVPFKAEDSSMLFHKISCARPTFPGTTSRTCESFIQRLLVKNPRRRMTPREAFEHPWLANAQTE